MKVEASRFKNEDFGLRVSLSGVWIYGFRCQLLRRNVKRFRGGRVLNAHRPFYHSTLGSRVIKKKTEVQGSGCMVQGEGVQGVGCEVQGVGCMVPSFSGFGFMAAGVRFTQKRRWLGRRGATLRGTPVPRAARRGGGVGFRVQVLGSGVSGLGFEVWSLGFGV